MKKRFLIATALLLLLTTYNSNKNLSFYEKFNVKKIVIDNNFIFKEETYQYVIPPSFGDEFLSESCQQQLTQLTKPWSLTWPKVK